jgi:hypothetical protein
MRDLPNPTAISSKLSARPPTGTILEWLAFWQMHGSAFAEEVAHHWGTTMPCLLRASQSQISMDGATVIPVLAEALAAAKDLVDPAMARTAKGIILRALQDQDDAVRAFTVAALGSYGDEGMIPP